MVTTFWVLVSILGAYAIVRLAWKRFLRQVDPFEHRAQELDINLWAVTECAECRESIWPCPKCEPRWRAMVEGSHPWFGP